MNKNTSKKRSIPRVLLVGSGRFGINHLRTLKELDHKKIIEFVGVVVKDKKKSKSIESEFKVSTYPLLSISLLKTVDMVDIVTPTETHFELVKKSLQYTNVFVEKPITTKEKEGLFLGKIAKKYKHKLMVGHIFRYHPVTEKLKKILDNKKMPKRIVGSFINPTDLDQGREPSFELLHFFDVIDFIWEKTPSFVFARSEGRVSFVDLRYEKNRDTHLTLGWEGIKKIRNLKFIYNEKMISADFILNTITIVEKNKKDKHFKCLNTKTPLEREIVAFIENIKGNKKSYIDAEIGSRIVSIAEKAIPKKKVFPKIAIIGGGIFGTSIAAELGRFSSITVFEKNSELMQEGSLINQFRHHYGYHYPRSDETVWDVKRSRADFEEIFEKALIRTIPTYYGLAKEGSMVNSKQFLTFCDKHKLPYKKSFPTVDLLSKKEIDVCIKVPEPSYHYEKLKNITEKRLKSIPNIKIRYDTIVKNTTLEKDGSKIVTYKKGEKSVKKEKFDFVINATYANINRFADWLNFEKYPIRVDLAEVLIVKLPIEPVSLTVVDGPFATLMPTGNKNEFTLYHVKESILDRYVPVDGLVKKPKEGISNREAIFKESLKLFPILEKAKIIESRVVHRGVIAYREYDDIRIADIIDHGFGCWSVLSGKILSSVTTSKRLAKMINNISSKIEK